MSVVDIEIPKKEVKKMCWNCLRSEGIGFNTMSEKGRCDICDALATVYPIKGD